MRECNPRAPHERPTAGSPLSEEQDAADVRRVLAGDVSAFEGIVKRWQKPIVNLTWRCSRRRDLAEDLAQEAFLKIYRSLDGWRGQSAFSTWMFAVALNHCRSRLRTIPREFAGLELAFDLPDRRACSADDESSAEIDALRRAVRGLPAHYREAIALHYFEQHDVRRAAALCAITPGTFKARLSRARALLTRALTRRESRPAMRGELRADALRPGDVRPEAMGPGDVRPSEVQHG